MPAVLGRTLSASEPNSRQDGARAALITLSAINLLNFADRYVPAAVKTLFQEELQLTDAETAYPTAAMLVVYVICACIFGVIADMQLMDRRVLLAIGVALWSLATMLAGLAHNVQQLIFFRALVGVGEAAYMTIVPPMISDFYPKSERNMAYAIFNVTMPFGGALGFALAGVIGALSGWRAAFFMCGAPGLILSLLILHINDPSRGINDKDIPSHSVALSDESGLAGYEDDQSQVGLRSSLCAMLSNPRYMFATFGLVAQSFAIGAFAEWYDTLLVREQVMSVATAGLTLGAATALGGICGTLIGSKVAGHFDGRLRSAFFLVPAAFAVPASLFALAATSFTTVPAVAIASIISAEICAFTATAPVNTVSISVIPVALRARSAGFQILLIHAFGDVLSPPLVGFISDRFESLRLALQLASVAFLVSGLWWWFGARCLEPLPVFSKEKNGDIDHDEHTSVGLLDLLCSGDGTRGPDL